MDCGTYFAKYVLCIFNFIIFLTGGVLVGLGIWLYSDQDSFISLVKTIDRNAASQIEEMVQPILVTHVSYLLMAAGGFIFVLSLIGYCGALRESRCLLGFYGFLLVVILILEIAVVGLAYFYNDKSETEIRSFLKNTIDDYYNPEKNQADGTTAVWNYIMAEMSCCGVNNYTDFFASDSFKQSGLKIPQACCKLTPNSTLLDPDCPKNPKLENSYMFTSCYSTIKDLLQEHMNIVIYVVIAIVITEILSTFLAFCLCKSIEPYDK